MRLLGLILISTLTGCSVYPLSSDVTSYESKHITRIIRCQTRAAIVTKIAHIMERYPKLVFYKGMTGAEGFKALSEDPFVLNNLRTDFSKQTAPTFRFYAETSVNYDFTIDSTEMNASGVDLSLLKSFTGGNNILGLSAKNDRTRQVKRQYRNYDNFDSLLRLPRKACENVPETANFLYPSIGLKRIDKLIDDFIDQNQYDNLGSKDAAEDAEMNDTMVFTTKTTGNFDPKLGRNAVPGAFVPSQLNINLDNYRQDIHTVIILIRRPGNLSKLPRFDTDGFLLPTSKQDIDAKFEEIRRNNFQDDVRNLSNSGTSILRAN